MISTITENNFKQEVQGHAGRVLIDFYTPTCPPCRAFAPTLEQIAAEQAGTLKVVKVDASVESELALEFRHHRRARRFVLLDSGDQEGPTDRPPLEEGLREVARAKIDRVCRVPERGNPRPEVERLPFARRLKMTEVDSMSAENDPLHARLQEFLKRNLEPGSGFIPQVEQPGSGRNAIDFRTRNRSSISSSRRGR